METVIKRILEETGANAVESFYFNDAKQKWVVEYKQSGMQPDEFEFFADVLDFLNNG